MKTNRTIGIEEIPFSTFFLETKSVLNPTVFITEPWINFLKKNVKGQAVAFRITLDSHKVLTYGFVVKIFGIKMFCSPFDGWNTPYIGFYSDSLIDNYGEIIRSLYKFLRKKYKILYFEITDKNIDCSSLKTQNIKFEVINNMNYDLSCSEEELLDKLPRHLKKRIRNYEKHGLMVETAEPNKEFVDLYYNQLIEVFALQNLKPFYSKEKVYSLFESFENNKDNIYCLKSFNADTKENIGTAIYLVYKNYAFTFGSASFSDQKKTNMNHIVRWEAIHHFKESGVTFYDFGGYNPYKLIFQPNIIQIPRIYMSPIPFMHFLKTSAKKIISLRRKIFKK